MSPAPVAVVTGASLGIGGATAKRLLSEGWSVVGVDREVAGFVSLSAAYAGRAAAVTGDVGERRTHESAVAAAAGLGRLSGWVNNAGIERPTHAHDFPDEDFAAVLQVNLYGVAYGCQYALREFLAHDTAGAIVNVGSIRGRVSFPGGFAYEATKGAVEMMTRSVAVEYGPRGIRCNGVRPGSILTPLSESLDIGHGPDREKRIAVCGRLHPLRYEMGQPEDVAAVIAFLLSPDARLVSGEMLAADGAATARCYPAESLAD